MICTGGIRTICPVDCCCMEVQMNHDMPTSLLRLGLVADSHGRVDVLKNAIDALRIRNVDRIVHLGDFCDSQNHDAMAEIFSLLIENRVLTVKGNNDYVVEKMLLHGELPCQGDQQRQWLTFLQKVPIIRRFEFICCCHSMPWQSIRAFYEPVDTGGTGTAGRIFRQTRDLLIFCGHSHFPVMFRYRNGHVFREPANGRSAVKLNREERYIVVVGAAENAECAVFDLSSYTYERIELSVSTDLGLSS